MAKLPNYNGSIDLISGLRPKNNGTFPLMEAHDIQVTETQRLDDMFSSPESWLPVYNGENEGGAEGGTGGSGGSGGNYVLELTGESGTLTDEQYQAVVDNFPNVVVKSGEYYYNGMQLTSTRYIFNVSGVVETAVGTVVTKQIQQSTIVVLRTSPQWVRVDTIVEIPNGGSSGGLTKTKVTINELVSMLTAENAGTRVDFIPKSTFRGVLPSNEAFLYMTGVFPTTGIIIQIAEDAFYIAGNGTAYTPALTSQFWDVSISVDSKARGIVTGATMNNGVLEANYQWNFGDYVTDEYFDFYIYK